MTACIARQYTWRLTNSLQLTDIVTPSWEGFPPLPSRFFPFFSFLACFVLLFFPRQSVVIYTGYVRQMVYRNFSYLIISKERLPAILPVLAEYPATEPYPARHWRPRLPMLWHHRSRSSSYLPVLWHLEDTMANFRSDGLRSTVIFLKQMLFCKLTLGAIWLMTYKSPILSPPKSQNNIFTEVQRGKKWKMQCGIINTHLENASELVRQSGGGSCNV